MQIAIAARLDDASALLCRNELADDDVLWIPADEELPVRELQLSACEVVFGTIPSSWIPALPALRWLQLESVGYEYYHEIAPLISERGIVITNLHGLFAEPAAETALAGVLTLTRGLDRLVAANRERRWQSLEVRPRTTLLARSTAVVLGTGSIGRQVRMMLEAFGCLVQSFARTSPLAELHTLAELDRALADADVVVSCLPSAASTRGLFDRDRIGLLSSTAVFVNVGRGDLVDESALVEALNAGRLGGAVLDVTRQEPVDAESELWSAPRLILTQHTGGGHRDELLDKTKYFLANLKRMRAGEPLDGIVNGLLGGAPLARSLP